jgi:hypothetical protein
LGPTKTAAQLYAGVDVSKDQLDVCLRWGEAERHDDDENATFFVTHDDGGIEALVSRFAEERPVLVIVEATGGFERVVVGALAAAGLPVAVVSILARCVTSPGPRGGSPRPIGSMQRFWRVSLKPSGRTLGPFPTKRPALCRGSSR